MILFVIISTLFQGNSRIVLRASSISTSITYICSNCFIDNVKVNFYYDIGAYYVCMYVCMYVVYFTAQWTAERLVVATLTSVTPLMT